MKSRFLGFSAKLAFAVLAVGTMFTSCYEKEEIDVTPGTKPEPAKYVIVGNVTALNTGEALVATVTIDGTAVTVNENGYFEKNDLTAGSHVVKAVMNNYFDAVKTVYLPETAAGGVCVVSADFALADASSKVVEPDQQVVPATEEQAKEMIAKNAETIIDAFKSAGIEGVSEEDLVFDPETGKATLKVPADASAAVGEALTVKLPYFTGFSSSVAPEDDNIFTKAVTEGQIWLASASNVLGREYGLNAGTKEVTFSAVAGKSIAAYNVTIVFKNEVYVFNGAEGTVMYQESWKAEPTYESHDSHDSHDGHGGNPGAGGGSAK